MKRSYTRMIAAGLMGGLLATSSAMAAEVDKKTERTWKAKCSSCHGMDGKAETKKGQEQKTESMASAAFQKRYTDDQLKKTILEGINAERNGVKKEMDGYKDDLKPEQVDAIVQYIRNLAP